MASGGRLTPTEWRTFCPASLDILSDIAARLPCKSLISCIVPFGTWIARFFLNKLEGRGDDRRHAVVELSAAHACRQNLTSIDRHCCGHNQIHQVFGILECACRSRAFRNCVEQQDGSCSTALKTTGSKTAMKRPVQEWAAGENSDDNNQQRREHPRCRNGIP